MSRAVSSTSPASPSAARSAFASPLSQDTTSALQAQSGRMPRSSSSARPSATTSPVGVVGCASRHAWTKRLVTHGPGISPWDAPSPSGTPMPGGSRPGGPVSRGKRRSKASTSGAAASTGGGVGGPFSGEGGASPAHAGVLLFLSEDSFTDRGSGVEPWGIRPGTPGARLGFRVGSPSVCDGVGGGPACPQVSAASSSDAIFSR